MNGCKITSDMTSDVKSVIDYKKLFQTLASAYIVFDIDDPTFTILEENEAHANIAMVKRGDAIGKPLFDVFPDTSKEYVETGESRLLTSIRKVIKTKKTDVVPHLRYDLRDKTGKFTPKYWNVSHHPVFDDNGDVRAVYQATEDVTDEIIRQKKLERAEYQLSQALTNGLIGTWMWDVNSNKVFADENLIKMFDLPQKHVRVGLPVDTFVDVIHPDDRERVKKEIHRTVKTRGLFECEYRTVSERDGVRWVIARGQVEGVEKGEAVHFPGVVVDITDRKNAEINVAFLTAASTQFSASLDSKKTLSAIAAMVVPHIADWCSIDLVEDGKIQRVATAHKDPQKVKWAEELYKKQGSPDINDASGVAKVLRTGEPEYYPDIPDELLVASAKDEAELELLRSLGFSSVIIVPLKIEDKTIGALSLIATESRVHYKPEDLEVAQGFANRAAMSVENARLYQSAQREIKERRLLQRKLEAANDALESRVVERTRQLVDTNDGLEKEIRRSQKIERELQQYSKSLARSNQELQDFAYVASHDLQEPLRKIQAFGDLLESEYGAQLGDGAEYLNRMRNAASRMSTLIQDLLAFSRVSTKPQDIKQVDLNVIVEDVISDLETRISEKNGKVVINKLPAVWADATHMRQLFQNLIGNALKFHKPDVSPEVKVTVLPRGRDDKYYEIHVTDNGIGFDEKYLDRIFSVFQRLHGKDAYDGTGIGLAVCRKIVERYGGKINAKSKPGAGSTFIIKLPIKHKEQQHDQ
jgi:PAS domain S-box-containing protein